MQSALKALADGSRRRILSLVAEQELTAGAIASHFDVSRPAISQHLGVLRSAGLVDERRDGTRRLYRIRPEGLDELKAFLDSFWATNLDKLKNAAELQERRQRRGADHARRSR